MNCIVLDQGNTSLKWGIFVNNSLVESGRILDNNLSLELNLLYSKHSLPFFYSSVRSVAEQTEFLNRFSFCRNIPEDNFPAFLYSSGIAGKDRLANVAGAFKIRKMKHNALGKFSVLKIISMPNMCNSYCNFCL